MLRPLAFWLLSCLLLLLSCGENAEEPLTIEEDKMIMILMDAHLLESALQDVAHSKRDTTKTKFYNQFYEIHGITEKEFLENLEIMDKQPKMLSRIYSKVMEEISKVEAEEPGMID